MAITEEIDLTLKLILMDGQQSPPSPGWTRVDVGSILFFTDINSLFFPEVARLTRYTRLQQPEANGVSFYLKMFGEIPSVEYEECLYYGYPHACERCGRDINLLNKVESLCLSCNEVMYIEESFVL